MTMGEQLIRLGEIMMILMNIFGKIYLIVVWFIVSLTYNKHFFSGLCAALNLVGHGAKFHPFS